MNAKVSNPQIELLAALLERLQPLNIMSAQMAVLTPKNSTHALWVIRYTFALKETMTIGNPPFWAGVAIDDALRDVGIDPDGPDFDTEEAKTAFQFNSLQFDGKIPTLKNEFNGVQVVIPLNVFPEFRKEEGSVDPIGLVTSY